MRAMFMTLIFGTLLTFTFKISGNISYATVIIMSVAWGIGDEIYFRLKHKSNKIKGDLDE